MTEVSARRPIEELLPVTVVLWLGYLLVLSLIDLVVYPHPIFAPIFYWINELGALAVLVLVLWKPGGISAAKGFLPVVIALLSVVPIVSANLVTLGMPPSPANGPEAVTLRLMPLLLMGLILTAWQYGWLKVVLYIAMITLLTLGLQVSFYRAGGAPLLPPLTILLIQTVSFLVVGYFVTTLIQRLRQQQESLERANAQLADFAATLEALTVSRERNRLARELHDTLAHALSGLILQLETVRAYWNINADAASAGLDAALRAARAGLQETRRALKSLRAAPLEELGLTLALRQLASETAEHANLALRLSLPEQAPVLPPAVEQCLYRVAQEAAANVVHHAHAQTLTVELKVNGAVLLRVADDGAGFDPACAPSAGHFGVSGMSERAHLIGGELTIRSGPGQGAEVILAIPDNALKVKG